MMAAGTALSPLSKTPGLYRPMLKTAGPQVVVISTQAGLYLTARSLLSLFYYFSFLSALFLNLKLLLV